MSHQRSVHSSEFLSAGTKDGGKDVDGVCAGYSALSGKKSSCCGLKLIICADLFEHYQLLCVCFLFYIQGELPDNEWSLKIRKVKVVLIMWTVDKVIFS